MTPLPRLYLVNLFALVATGVLVSGWFLYYTEWFEVVGGILGLGGLFAWAAFVVGLLTDDSKEKLQAGFESGVLLRWRTVLVCAVVVIAFGVLTFGSGTLVMDAEAEDMDRMVSVSIAGSEESSASRVPAHAIRRLWIPTGFGQTKLRVKVAGLPGLDADLRPPFRTQLRVPTAFEGRPLLLVRTTHLQSGSLANKPDDFKMLVNLAGKSAVLHPYGGQSVWIGTEDDVPIPAPMIQRWRESVIAAVSVPTSESSNPLLQFAVDRVLARWSSPRAVFADATLRPGQQATVEVWRISDNQRFASASVAVRPVGNGDAIQDVVLE